MVNELESLEDRFGSWDNLATSTALVDEVHEDKYDCGACNSGCGGCGGCGGNTLIERSSPNQDLGKVEASAGYDCNGCASCNGCGGCE